MVVALAIALGNLRLVELPQGGGISFASLPILLLALTRGWRPALLAGWCAGVGHALFGATVVHPVQLLLDYGLAQAALAAAALAARPSSPPSRSTVALGVLLGSAAQLAVFTTSGAVFFASYAGASSPVAYSLAYNAAIVVPEAIIATLVLPTLLHARARAFGGTPRPPSGRHQPAAATARPTLRLDTPAREAAESPIASSPHHRDQPGRALAARAAPFAAAQSTRAAAGGDVSSGTSPSGWRSSPPPRGFAR